VKNIALIVLCLVFIRSAWALTPPWSDSMLEQDSDLVVEGEIGEPILCLGLVDQNKCFDKKKFSVPLKVKKVIKGKGKKEETLKLTFFYYDYSKSNCVGDQAATVRSGERGIYYLKKLGDGSYQIVHWSGAKVLKEGTKGIPKCP